MVQLACVILAACVLSCQVQISRLSKRLRLLDTVAEQVGEISDDFYGPEGRREW